MSFEFFSFDLVCILTFMSTDFILSSKRSNSMMIFLVITWQVRLDITMHQWDVLVKVGVKRTDDLTWIRWILLSKDRTYKSVTNGFLFYWLVWYFLPNFFSHKWDLQGSLSLSEFQKKSNKISVLTRFEFLR